MSQHAIDPVRPGRDAEGRNIYSVGLGYLGGSARARVFAAGDIGTLAAAVLRALVTGARGWMGEAAVQLSLALRRCGIPMVVSALAFLYGYQIVVFGVVLGDLGAADRHAAGITIGALRETSVWITTMIFAGVAGSAVCADIGSRKVREEFDALAVMGVDRLRTVVLPRVVGLTLGAVALGMLALAVTLGSAVVLTPVVTGIPRGVFWDGMQQNIQTIDVIASLIKYAIIGFFVAVVACQKGLEARGGTKGVGMAVNQTVVLSFLGIWIINLLFNLALLTAFPDTAAVRG